VDLRPLRALARDGDGRDRAYVDAMTRLQWSRARDAAERATLEELHRAVQGSAREAHRALRGEIASGALRGPSLRHRFDEVPPLERDHFVEEVLGIAYPPLDETAVAQEVVGYAPSGYDEIVHALDVTALAPGDRFLDIGSGAGKAVLLAALLCGATSAGIERETALHDVAVGAARELGLRVDDARFVHGDAREASLDDMHVFFMYLPFTGAPLEAVMTRLSENVARRSRNARRPFLCAGALDESRWADLVPAGPPRSWLHVYSWR
jgi:hypothetical protein